MTKRGTRIKNKRYSIPNRYSGLSKVSGLVFKTVLVSVILTEDYKPNLVIDSVTHTLILQKDEVKCLRCV